MTIRRMAIRLTAQPVDNPGEEFCQCCEKPLKKAVYLEYNLYTGLYYAEEGKVPEEQSQGWFPFGITCAKSVLQSQLIK